jgi:hypothetical protein
MIDDDLKSSPDVPLLPLPPLWLLLLRLLRLVLHPSTGPPGQKPKMLLFNGGGEFSVDVVVLTQLLLDGHQEQSVLVVVARQL